MQWKFENCSIPGTIFAPFFCGNSNGVMNIPCATANAGLLSASNFAWYQAVGSPNPGDVIKVNTTQEFRYIGNIGGIVQYVPWVSPISSVTPLATCTPPIQTPGCTDPNAYNYNAAATVDDGSCLYCSDELPSYTNVVVTPATVASGCLLNNDGSISWTPNLHVSSNCPQFLASWVLDSGNQVVWQTGIHPPGVSISTGNILAPGIYKVYIQDCHECEITFTVTVLSNSATAGCMDSGFMASAYINNQGGTGSYTPGTAATNYSAIATCDDGTCLYASTNVYGCTDSTALNYNPAATIDNGSCVYPPGPSGPTSPISPTDPDILDPCCIVAIAIQWANKVSVGTVDCSDDLMIDLIISVALYDMVIDTEIIE